MSVAAASLPVAVPAPRNQWFVSPAVDLLIGCGLWSVPLMLITTQLSLMNAGALAFAFYILTFFCNYPHYMATIYRAYGTRADFNKYKVFTVYLTIFMALTALVTHSSHAIFGEKVNLVPYFITFYLTWSPYHYMGQNFGLTMMFARKNGAVPSTRTRDLLRASYLSSYVLIFAAIHAGNKGEANMLSLGIPQHISEPIRILALIAFVGTGFPAMYSMVKQVGLRRMIASIGVFLTQITWFCLPAAFEVILKQPPPPVYYSTGILAFMHCAQYLWITGYYAKRETEAGLRGGGNWRPFAYYGALIVGGIALFIPGPWIVSRVMRYDLAESVLIFSSLINIHHFMLDGAIWKLRDGRIAQLLLGAKDKNAIPDGAMSDYLTGVAGWFTGQSFGARTVRWSLVGAMLGIASLDVAYRYLVRETAPMDQIELAQKLNPWDTTTSFRRADILSNTGRQEEAMAELRRGIALNPFSAPVQRLLPLLLAREGVRLRDQHLLLEAEAGFAYLPMLFRPDFSTLANWGIVAVTLGRDAEGLDRLKQAVEVAPQEADGHLYLGDAYNAVGKYAEAADSFTRYLELSAPAAETPEGREKRIVAGMKVADALAKIDRPQDALFWYRDVMQVAKSKTDFDMASQACLRAAEVQEKSGLIEQGAGLFREGIALAEKSGYGEPKGRAWYLYAGFLRRNGAPAPMVMAAYDFGEEELRGSLSPAAPQATESREQYEKAIMREDVALARADGIALRAEALVWKPAAHTPRVQAAAK